MAAGPATIGFPDAPRSELERTIEELIERAQKVLETEGRLRDLLQANSAVVEKLELGEVLRRIIEAAVSLVDAQYGALGVISPDGELEQFIHVGMSPEDATAIGQLPRGHGILGAVIEAVEAIRLDHLADDPRSAGFPEHHPAMDSFLGVPIRVRDEIFGNLYLTNRSGGRFSAEDEELVAALAATAGIAIDNARLFEAAERRQRWSAALAEVTAALLSGADDVLSVIADKAGSIVDADLVCIIEPADDEGMLRVRLARGSSSEIEGRVYAAEQSLAGRALSDDTIASAEAETIQAADWQAVLGPSIALPLKSAGESLGVLTLSRRPGASRFLPTDLEMAAEFAAQAGVAIELGRGRKDSQRLELVNERSRIARDLHDHVIQRLFAAGLSLQTIAETSAGQAREILEQVEVIDAAISDIRTAVFTLAHGRRTTARHRVLDIAIEVTPSLGFSPRVVFAGPVDVAVTGPLADDVAAVVREALTNVARHAGAGSASVVIEVDDEWVRIVVEDDGRGIPEDARRASGTANLAERATSRSGAFTMAPGHPSGSRVEWTARLDSEGAP